MMKPLGFRELAIVSKNNINHHIDFLFMKNVKLYYDDDKLFLQNG